MLAPDKENSILEKAEIKRVVGIDEVGRGCWAGPVVVCAYLYYKGDEVLNGVNDSKKVSAKRREAIAGEASADRYKLRSMEPSAIDRFGIGKAVTQLVSELIAELDDGSTAFILDGGFPDLGANVRVENKADSNWYVVAAASVIAKVFRDKVMTTEAAATYPEYGFESHKGYGTRQHVEALAKLGVTAIHRQSYIPVKQYLNAGL